MRLSLALLDSQPSYLGAEQQNPSLLFTGFATGTVLGHLCARLERLTVARLIIVAPPRAEFAAYRAAVAASCPRATVCDPCEFAEALATCERSDGLLMLDAQVFHLTCHDLTGLVDHYKSEPRASHHLVMFDSHKGTRERVSFDRSGKVRGIQRHYERATWPFMSAIAATILPVEGGVVSELSLPSTLGEIHQAIAARGVPTRDWPTQARVIDLTSESGFLAANEALIGEALAARGHGAFWPSPILVGDGQSIHRHARIIGPVVIHANAVIEEGATVIGPAFLGEACRVGCDAVVAHAVIGPGVVVAGGQTVYDCVSFGPTTDDIRRTPLRTSFAHEMARFTNDHDYPNQALPTKPSRPMKRTVDIAGASIGLVALTPLLAVVGALICLQRDGPVLFGDEREGLGGRTFKCWKFRTMSCDAQAAQTDLSSLNQTDGPHFKVARDPRVTTLGALLRATNIDELPQLFNVLMGEMSLVGPRPSPFRENQLCVAWREGRISVRPGITGLWQICRHDRASGDFHQWIEYDLLYVQHMTIWLDLKILFATLLTMTGFTSHFDVWRLVRTDRNAPLATKPA